MSIERNAPCPCGSGKKYKHCCGQIAAAPANAAGGAIEFDQQPLLDLFALQRYAELEQMARAQIAAGAQSGFVWKALGVALKMQGKDARAAMQRAANLAPGDAEAQFNLGNAHKDAGDFSAATACYRRALALRPGFALAHNNLGLAFLGQGIHDQALASFEAALTHGGGMTGAHINIGNTLMQMGEYEAAAHHYRQALDKSVQANVQANVQADAQAADAGCGLAAALRKLGKTDAAIASCQATLQAAAQHSGAWALLGALRADQGDFAAARSAYEEALAHDARNAHALAGLAQTGKMSTADDGWRQAAQTLAEDNLPPADEAALRFALGKYFDDCAEYEQAFASFQRANALLQTCSPPYQPDQHAAFVDKLIAVFDSAWFASIRRAERTGDDALPVFVIGMPRSGTSLVEQMLAAHPEAYGAGELSFWTRALLRHNASALVSADGGRIVRELAREYLQLLRQFSPDAQRIADKMPANFLMTGLIHAALPQARFIHVMRDPADTGLSIYFQHFDSAHAYANDLRSIAHYTLQYRRLMQHWRSLLPPDALLEVQYEELVTDPAAQSRRLIEFTGLPWDARCLEFTQHRRAVGTASNWQVRQPVNRNAIGRWRHYEQHIGPLLALRA